MTGSDGQLRSRGRGSGFLEINDGILAPRFAPSQRVWVLSGIVVSVNPSVPASEGKDADAR
jgi:hypothetical protein